MSEQDKITLYMPTHNRCEMLQRAIASVRQQSWGNIELIVVDDGSEDGTWSYLQQLSEDYSVLKPMRHATPKGACAARNTAIQAASGKFITGLDDDDELLPEHLESLYQAWNERYACVVASLQNDNGVSRVLQGSEYGRQDLRDLLHYNRLGNQIFTLTERLRAIGGFDEQLPAFQDYDCWVRMLAAYGPALKLRTHSYILHTAHEANRISGNREKRLQALDYFIEKHKDKFSSSHRLSMALLRERIEDKPVGLVKALKYLRPGNYRAVISAYRHSKAQAAKATDPS